MHPNEPILVTNVRTETSYDFTSEFLSLENEAFQLDYRTAHANEYPHVDALVRQAYNQAVEALHPQAQPST